MDGSPLPVADSLTADSVAARVRTLLSRKLVVGSLLGAVFALPYYANQRVVLRPLFPMPATRLDRLVPFQPGATWVYLSWYLMLPVSPLLLSTRDQMRRYALGIILIGLIGNLIFLLSPTGVTRPQVGAGVDWVYRAVAAFDRPVNACPSLHAALAVFTSIWFARLCYAPPRLPLRRPGVWVAAMWAWTAAILYGTLATRQHVVLDLVAGAALGALGYAITTRPRQASDRGGDEVTR